MEIRKLGKRTILCTFTELEGYPTNVLLLEGNARIYTCDTFLGPRAMQEIEQEASQGFHGTKENIVFNSHGDWDHHWGNCFFHNASIIAHRETRKCIIKSGDHDLSIHGDHAMGKVIITPPSTTFTRELTFHDDGISFFHAPGHTPDSSACMDLINGVLFAGDDVEYPIPCISSPDVSTFIDTLTSFLEMEVALVIPGHGIPVAGLDLVRDNLRYLESLEAGNPAVPSLPRAREIHGENEKILHDD